MRARVLMILGAALALAACKPQPAPLAQPALPAPQECGADGLQGLVGQPRAVINSMTLPPATRVLGPDSPVTADFRPDRLNIEIDNAGLIKRVSCY